MKYLLIVLLAVFLPTGCIATKLFVPDVDTRMTKNELDHLKNVNTDFNDTLVTLAGKTDLKTDKGKLNFAKLALKASKEAGDISPTAAENMIQQYMRMAGQETLDAQLDQGVEWTTELIGQVAGGGVAGGGGLAYVLALLRRKNRALRVVNSELGEDEKRKVKKALEHTGSEKEVT
jgi:hypothetical protein